MRKIRGDQRTINSIDDIPQKVIRKLLKRMHKHRKTLKETGCWIWSNRHRTQNGHVQLKLTFNGKTVSLYSHVAAYIIFRDDIPIDLDLDHTCEVPDCFSPFHVEPLSRNRNISRGKKASKERGQSQRPAQIITRHELSPVSRLGRPKATHCWRGHEYTPENTRTNTNGHKICRTCRAAKDPQYYANARMKQGKPLTSKHKAKLKQSKSN